MDSITTKASVDATGKLTAQVNGVAAGDYDVTLTLTPIAPPEPQFSDTAGHWAQPFIAAMAKANFTSGFPDGTFRPNQRINRAQFAALMTNVFKLPLVRDPIQFVDVNGSFWAAKAIAKTYQMGILSGFPNREFRPNLEVTKIQVLIALVNALDPPPSGVDRILLPQYYTDWAEIPSYGEQAAKYATRLELVVNYPDLERLRPNQAVTRGEVCTMIYQALVQTGRMPKITSSAIVAAPSPPRADAIPVAHQREFRGVWVASVWNINFPSRAGLPTATQQQELRAILDTMVNLNLNALIFQVRPEGDALYASSREPWSSWLTGKQGTPPDPFYDPLAYVVEEAHKRAIEVHAWFNPYRAQISRNTPVVPPHIDAVYPGEVYNYGSGRWMDPGSEIVQNRTYDVILDVVKRYDIDGIHLDDYFYPYPKPDEPFPDSKTYDQYRKTGGSLGLADWRRDNVNKMVKRLSTGIRATKPYVKFGISPFGIYRPGQPEGIRGLDQYAALYADPKEWLAQGWVDYIAPQLYWKIDQVQQSYPVLLKWWTENNPKGAHIYPGNNLVKLDNAEWPVSEFEWQVSLTRDLNKSKALGNIYYNIGPLLENTQNVREMFRTKLYPDPSLVPALNATGGTRPALPVKVTAAAGRLSWQAPANQDLWGWTIYEAVPGGWTLRQLLPAASRAVNLNPGTYAICTVDRLKQESEGVMIAVS
jgi:uncharacterized lipoprotein YddW (UPF0748 family)